MSEVNPNDPHAAFHDPDALTRGDVPADPARKPDPDQKANADRDADLAKLAELQKEYVGLKDKVSKGAAAQSQAVATDPVAAAHARKGDVVREMDVIKRKYGLA